MPITSPRVCPVMVGRERELAFLTGLLSAARDGRCRLVAITGEAGAGKSRLVAELAASAATADVRMVTDGCSERDLDYPFAPFVDALRQWLTEQPDGAAAVPADLRGFLAAVLPELVQLVPPASVARAPSPEQAQRLWFEAIITLLGRLAAGRPLLLILEDLHWADPTSLELLELLPRRLADARLLILITARTDEPESGLGRTLLKLRRMRLLEELALEPLTERDVGQMLDALLPAPPTPALTAAVSARTGGNPFFIEELLAAAPASVPSAWFAGDVSVPRTVGDAVRHRLESLTDRERAVIELAAVLGQRVDTAVLQVASRLPEDDLAAAVDTLVEGHLLREARAGGRTLLTFHHALTRDAIHERLPASMRRRLHRAVGEALQARSGVDAREAADPGEMGSHFHAAEIWEPTLDYALAAADRARRANATVEALIHDRRALDAALALDSPVAAELHRRCGQALALLGAFEEARWHLTEGLRLARAASDRTGEQATLYDFAGLFASRDYGEAERLATEALALAREIGDARREALALNRLGKW